MICFLTHQCSVLHSYELKNKYTTIFFNIFVASVAQRIFVKN
jgi:hypothetical protein